jgi:hypothetical protein
MNIPDVQDEELTVFMGIRLNGRCFGQGYRIFFGRVTASQINVVANIGK